MTRKDVARYVGVSPATVTYALAGNGEISEATRERVLQAVRLLGYRPNAAARSLKLGNTKTLGLIVPNTSNAFFAQFSYAVSFEASKLGYSLILAGADVEDGTLDGPLNNLAARQVDGIIVAGEKIAVASLETLTNIGARLILLNQASPVPGVFALGPDLYGGARKAVRHLIEHGHKDVGYVGGVNSSDPRYRGWYDEITSSGLAVAMSVSSDYSHESGYRSGAIVTGSDRRPSGIFVSSDAQAIGFLRATHEAGVRVPEDLALVAFDGLPETEFTWPPLTTMRQPMQQMAHDAVSWLVNDVGREAFVQYEATLLARRSCGCG